MKGGRAAESLLPEASISGQLYSCLLDAARDCSVKANAPSSGPGRKKRGRGRGRRGRGARGGGIEAEDMNNRFALLLSEEDEDD